MSRCLSKICPFCRVNRSLHTEMLYLQSKICFAMVAIPYSHWRFGKSNALQMEPFKRTRLVITGNHFSIRYLLTSAIQLLILIIGFHSKQRWIHFPLLRLSDPFGRAGHAVRPHHPPEGHLRGGGHPLGRHLGPGGQPRLQHPPRGLRAGRPSLGSSAKESHKKFTSRNVVNTFT